MAADTAGTITDPKSGVVQGVVTETDSDMDSDVGRETVKDTYQHGTANNQS